MKHMYAGQKEYEEYMNGGYITEAVMSYGDYLDYWVENYYKTAFKHQIVEDYLWQI